MTTDSKTRGFWGGGWTRGLAVLGLIVVGGLMQGCIIETHDGPPAVCGDGNITVEWVITAGGPQFTKSCAQVGATTVSMLVDDTTMIVDFDCSTFAGTTPAIQGGVTHTITMSLSDDAGNTLSALKPTPVFVPCDSIKDVGTVEFSLTP
jgi:hypothetical protein